MGSLLSMLSARFDCALPSFALEESKTFEKEGTCLVPGSLLSVVGSTHCRYWATPTLDFSSLDPAPSLASLSFS